MGMSYDFNGKRIITKGTTVRVRTNNGGEKIGILSANHYPTYDAVIDEVVIPSYRIETLSIVDNFC